MVIETLHRLRFPADGGRGRRYPEPPHPYRTEFQRDRDRIIHSKAFRRLENKTQVFASGLSDHFRNRLTHTIEVSQIARTVAGALGLNEDFVEALALGHDIGHPPFAHAGEAELDARMRAFGERFDHNLHALRIVESFEQRYAQFPGLNLTFEVREGIVKHSRDYAPGEEPIADPYLPGLRPPLEAQLVDLADEVAYNTGDLDDAFSARIIELDQVAEAVPMAGELIREARREHPGATAKMQFQEANRKLFDWLVSGLIAGTAAACREAGVNNADDVRRYPSRLAGFAQAPRDANRELKRFLFSAVYTTEELLRQRERCRGMVGDLFQHYLADPSRLPEQHSPASKDAPLHRVVCDYIAGMTDPFLERAHRQAFPESRSGKD